MKHLLPLLLLISATQWLHGQNTCNTALPVEVGTYVVPGIDGDPPIPSCIGGGNANNGEWYVFWSTANQNLVVSSDLPGNGNVDTRVQIYIGACGALSCVGGDDDGGTGFLSHVTVPVNANTLYYIVWDNRYSSAGFSFSVSVGSQPPPANGPTFTAQPGFTGSSPLAIVDMNGDHLDDVVIVGSNFVIMHHQQPGGGFLPVNIPTPPALHTPSWSLAAGDLTGNGRNDLMYGGGQGVSFMFQNASGTGFTHQGFPQYIFSQRTNMVDLNNDGLLDAFVCHDVDANVYFLNGVQGTPGILTYYQGGMGSTCGNYGSIFTDVDNDGLVDCFVAKCGCDPVDLMMLNNGNLSWTNIAAPNGMADNHQSWSSAWGDFDNDGDMDVLIGSSSSNYHKLMRNNGNGTFTNVTAGSGFDAFLGTSIEWTTHDFDNDGFLDIMGGGRLMMGNGDLTFNLRPGNISNGPIGDLNNDGFLDYTNGTTAYFNNGNDNHWLKVVTVGTVSNINGIGARVEVLTAQGMQIRDIRSGDGFKFMSSLTGHFGLGQATQIEQVTVYWPSGIVQTIHEPAIDQMLVIVEGVGTDVTGISAEETLGLYPNPTGQWIGWNDRLDLGGGRMRILDAAGQIVLEGSIATTQVDVSSLPAGVYLFRAEKEGRVLIERFVKR
ncbi:MAG: VCBS repeat-containing protein [Flavobacteriales bacterium]|nr:VCBS repeat-containing protein [Flavobacteriales bacterium]